MGVQAEEDGSNVRDYGHHFALQAIQELFQFGLVRCHPDIESVNSVFHFHTSYLEFRQNVNGTRITCAAAFPLNVAGITESDIRPISQARFFGRPLPGPHAKEEAPHVEGPDQQFVQLFSGFFPPWAFDRIFPSFLE